MKHVLLSGLITVFLSQSACTRMAQRIVYGSSQPATVNKVQTVKTERVTAKPSVSQPVQATKPLHTSSIQDRPTSAYLQASARPNSQQPVPKQEVHIIQQVEHVKIIDSSDTANELRKELEAFKLKAESDMQTLKNELTEKNSQITQSKGTITVLQQKISAFSFAKDPKIDSLKKAYDDLYDTYARYKAGTEQMMQSPAFHRNAVVIDGHSLMTTHYVEPTTSHKATFTKRIPRSEQVYHLGPRGGCFYYTASGRKEYVDRSLCH